MLDFTFFIVYIDLALYAATAAETEIYYETLSYAVQLRGNRRLFYFFG